MCVRSAYRALLCGPSTSPLGVVHTDPLDRGASLGPRRDPLGRWRMSFRILGEITDAETIATGSGIREIARLGER